jgi:hypothetical protein
MLAFEAIRMSKRFGIALSQQQKDLLNLGVVPAGLKRAIDAAAFAADARQLAAAEAADKLKGSLAALMAAEKWPKDGKPVFVGKVEIVGNDVVYVEGDDAIKIIVGPDGNGSLFMKQPSKAVVARARSINGRFLPLVAQARSI